MKRAFHFCLLARKCLPAESKANGVLIPWFEMPAACKLTHMEYVRDIGSFTEYCYCNKLLPTSITTSSTTIEFVDACDVQAENACI